MSHVLIIYGTTQGHTAKVAARVGDRCQHRGYRVTVRDVATLTPQTRLDSADGVVVLGSVHVGKHQGPLAAYVAQHASAWSAKPALFISVSLSANSDDPEERAAVASIAQDFLTDTGLRADITHLAAGGVHDREMGWLSRWMLHQIVRAHGRVLDPSGDTDFTDWPAVDAATDAFLALVDKGR